MKIGVIVAMEKELCQLKTFICGAQHEQRNGYELIIGHIGNNNVCACLSGIGKVNSAVGTATLITCFRPDAIVSTGVAGGASTQLRVLDIVVSTECAYHDVYCGTACAYGQLQGMPPRFVSPGDLVAQAISAGETGTTHKGLIVSGDWFVDTKEKMRAILNRFPEALAVDMESCSIAQTCCIFNVPFISFRVISDVPLTDSHASQYFNFWERMANGSFTLTKAFLENLRHK